MQILCSFVQNWSNCLRIWYKFLKKCLLFFLTPRTLLVGVVGLIVYLKTKQKKKTQQTCTRWKEDDERTRNKKWFLNLGNCYLFLSCTLEKWSNTQGKQLNVVLQNKTSGTASFFFIAIRYAAMQTIHVSSYVSSMRTCQVGFLCSVLSCGL